MVNLPIELPSRLSFMPECAPRYGYGKMPHQRIFEIFFRAMPTAGLLVEKFGTLRELLAKIPLHHHPAAPAEPYWRNGWFPGYDAIALYGLISVCKPYRFVEIGSGHSTLFARRAIRDLSLDTTITSIDPEPRTEVDVACDVIHRTRLENFDLAFFDTLESGDFLFIDSSHLVFMNSDVTVLFMEVLPRLKKGVIVHFHDIRLPDDYPTEWIDRYYAEQYLIGSILANGGSRYQVLLPNAFMTTYARGYLSGIESFWSDPVLSQVERHGASLWIRVTEEPL